MKRDVAVTLGTLLVLSVCSCAGGETQPGASASGGSGGSGGTASGVGGSAGVGASMNGAGGEPTGGSGGATAGGSAGNGATAAGGTGGAGSGSGGTGGAGNSAGGGTGGTGGPPLARQWTEQSSPVPSDLQSLASNGEVIVAAGMGRLIYSEDGATWQEPDPPVAADEVVHGGGRFVAVGDGASAFSDDGRSWTMGTVQPDVPVVTYGAGRYLLMTYLGTDGAYSYSLDGETWMGTTAEPPSVREGFLNIGANSAAGDILIASRATVLAGGNFTSHDGITWLAQPAWGGLTYDVAFGSNLYCASAASGQFHASEDGDTWETYPGGDGETMLGITYADDAFFAVGGFGTLIASRDCRSWEPASDPPQPSYLPNGNGLNLSAIRLHKDRLVVVGGSGTILTSP